MTSASEKRPLRGIYPLGKDYVARTDQGGVKEYIVVARTGRVWFVASDPSVERVE